MNSSDKPIKNKVDSHASEVDVNEIWATIEPEVDAINAERRKRRLIPFFWLFGVLALGVSVGGYWMWASADATSQLSDVAPKVSQISNETSSAETVSLADATTTQSNDNVSKSKTATQTASPSNTKESFITDNNINNSTSPKFHFVKPTPNPTPQAQSNATPQSGGAFDLPVGIDEDATVTQEPVAQKGGNLPSLSDGLQATSDGEVELRGLAGELNRGSIALDLLDFDALVVSDEELDWWVFYDLPAKDKEGKNDDKKRKKEKPFEFSIASRAGLAFVNRDLTVAPNTEGYKELVSARNQTEKPLEAQNYGLYVQLKHKSDFTFTTGLHRTIITELYEYNNVESSTKSVDGIATRVVQLNGDTLDFGGVLEETTTTTYNQKVYNRYRFWEVPLLIGYEKTKNEWSYGVKGGVSVLIHINGDGQIRMPENYFESLNTRQHVTSFYQFPRLNYQVGGYVKRALGEHLSLSLAPYFRRYSKSILFDERISQKYSLIGADLSVGWKF